MPKSAAQRCREYRARKKAQRNGPGQHLMETKSLTSTIFDDNECIVKNEPLHHCEDISCDNNHLIREYRHCPESSDVHLETKSSTIIEENPCIVKKEPLEQNAIVDKDIKLDNNHYQLHESQTKSATDPIIDNNVCIVKKEPLDQNTNFDEDILHQENSYIYQDSKSSTGTVIDDNICIVKNEPLEQNFIVYEDISRDNNQSLLREYPQCPGNLDVNHQDSSSTSEHLGGNTEQLSGCSGNVRVVREGSKIPKTSAERSREYRKRKKIIRDLIYKKAVAKTSAQRSREYRARRKKLRNLNQQTSTSEPSTSTRNTLADIHVQQPDHIEDPIDDLCLLQFL